MCTNQNEIKEEVSKIDSLILNHSNDLYNYCYKLTLSKPDADDLFQQTWLKATKSIDKTEGMPYKSWLFKICSNQYKDNYRKKVVYDKVFKDDFLEEQDKDFIMENSSKVESAEEVFESQRRQELLLFHVIKLPKKLKLPIILHYFEGIDYESIATTLDIPLGTVKSRINTAKKRLNKEMKGEIHG